MKMFMFEANPI